MKKTLFIFLLALSACSKSDDNPNNPSTSFSAIVNGKYIIFIGSGKAVYTPGPGSSGGSWHFNFKSSESAPSQTLSADVQISGPSPLVANPGYDTIRNAPAGNIVIYNGVTYTASSKFYIADAPAGFVSGYFGDPFKSADGQQLTNVRMEGMPISK